MLENRTTLVIADDNPTNRRALVDYFDSIPSFAVLGEAKNGVEAVELVQALRPDLLILDDVLPHLDGLGVLGRLDPVRGPKVLMLMSCASDSMVQLYSEAGATYCLLRPAAPELVAERAAFLVDRHITLSDRSVYPAPMPIRTVSDLLRQTGVPAHLQGFRYLKAAVQYVLDNGGDLCAMTKELYPAVARMHGTVPARVERSIRHAIEVAWNRADLTELQRLFGATINHSRGKPTNSEFVAMLADHLRSIAS
ncbi:MAG TPA: sporulation transcription factor Spo0A [Symbiobacteriaceae bacterium]|nr:sporulation transcription factor Spo0A [Symbiobacteriaceae bacterium]